MSEESDAIDAEVERVARGLAVAEGLDPDKVSFEDILTPRVTWRLFVEQAKSQIDLRVPCVKADPDVDIMGEVYVSYTDYMGFEPKPYEAVLYGKDRPLYIGGSVVIASQIIEDPFVYDDGKVTWSAYFASDDEME